MGNNFAFFALFIFPIIGFILYLKFDNLVATTATITSGYLFLPVRTAFDLPYVPPINKESITMLTVIIGSKYIAKDSIKSIFYNPSSKILFLALLLMGILSNFTNSLPYFDGALWIKGLEFHDMVSSLVNISIRFISFILAMQIIKDKESQLKVFKILIIFGLIYTIPILFEIRMSPQLHTWVYGFFPHSFLQQARDGGFRPVVFMGHGLLVAMFLTTIISMSLIYLKYQKNIFKNQFIPTIYIILYLAITLILSKSLGALILVILFFILIHINNQNLRVRIIVFMGLVVLIYPILSLFDLFPHENLVNLISTFSYERAQSLDFRFFHEHRILEHAFEKALFGWGEWGRFKFHDSIVDGYGIITLSTYGLYGFLLIFGMMISPLFFIKKKLLIIQDVRGRDLLINYGILVLLIAINQIPNASLNSWYWFLIGGFVGRLIHLKQQNLSF